QTFHAEGGELAAQFAADASRSTGNEDGLVAEAGGDLHLVHVDFVAAEQVLYLDFPDTRHEPIAAHLVHGRGNQHPDMVRLAVADEPFLLDADALVIGEQDTLDAVPGDDMDEVLLIVEIVDGQVGQPVRLVILSVIVESDYLVLPAVAHTGFERHAPVVHTVDEQVAVAFRYAG